MINASAYADLDATTRVRTALADQHRFLNCLLRYKDRAAFDLRIIADQGRRLQVVLLGRTWNEDQLRSAEQAEGLRDIILATLPRYVISSEIESRDEIASLLNPLRNVALEGAIISKTVISGVPSRPDAKADRYFSVAPFNPVDSEWNSLYLALSVCTMPTVISVGLFPTTVPQAFHAQLADSTAYYGRLARPTHVPGGIYFRPQWLAPDPFAVEAEKVFHEYQQRYIARAFGMRIQIASGRLAGGIVQSLGEAIAPSAPQLGSQLDRPRAMGTHQSTIFSGKYGSHLLHNNLSAIEPQCRVGPSANGREEFLSLLSNLGDAADAACAFRLPIAANGVIPGFQLVDEEKQSQAHVHDRRRITVFVSYRREDTRHAAARLADKLEKRFERVFMDIGAIKPGMDFTEAIAGAVNECEVLLALIGTQWVEILDEHGRRRLDDPDDWVAKEIRIALDRGAIVIPVLVDGAQTPRPGDLPRLLRPLVTRQSVTLRHESFTRDAAALIAAIERLLGNPRSPEHL